MKKSDKILAAGLLLAAILLGFFLFIGKQEGTWAVVTVDGTEVGKYNLKEAQTLDLGTGNHLEISDGEVWMTEADCPDQICVKSGKISKEHEMIVCMPHKVIVEIRKE